MGVINSPLVEGGVFSEEVNKKEVTVNGVNSKHHKRNRKIYSVSEVKYEWHDDCIGNNRRDRRKKTVAAAESVSKYCSDQCCDASENNVYRNGTAKEIGNDTSHK